VTPLSPRQGRVVGSLIEKELTTPQQYPLTANALVLACNQSSNREPVVAYTESEVTGALDELRQLGLVRFVLPSHGRSVVRYRQVLGEVLGLDTLQLALVSMLLLRGPQTVGELRTRSGRLADLGPLDAVERELTLLAAHEPPLVVRVPRRPGQKEDRWTELLGRPEDPAAGGSEGAAEPERSSSPVAPAADADAVGTAAVADVGGGPATLRPDVDALREELGSLRHELSSLRTALDELRSSLGG
jgi:uncharacterized protein